MVGRLGFTEFFVEERGEAAGVAALEQLAAGDFAGAYPVLREDPGLVLGGERAADVLAQVCNVNFGALDIAQRPVVMTLMVGVGVLVLPQQHAGRRRHLSNLVRPELRDVPVGNTRRSRTKNAGEKSMNAAEAQALFAKHEIKFVLAQFVDIHGAAKAKAVPVEHLDMVLSDGAGFAGFALWGFGMGPHGPDYMAVGDLVDAHAHSLDAGLRAPRLQRHRQGQAVSVLLARRAQAPARRGSPSEA